VKARAKCTLYLDLENLWISIDKKDCGSWAVSSSGVDGRLSDYVGERPSRKSHTTRSHDMSFHHYAPRGLKPRSSR